MRARLTLRRLVLLGICLLGVAFTGCAWTRTRPEAEMAMVARPYVAILPFGMEVEITTLSAVKSVDGILSAEEETQQVAGALREIRAEARWLFLSRLATGQKFRFVPLEQTDALAAELQLPPGVLPTAAQLSEFRSRLGTDLVVAGSILDYGQIRWQWLAAGAFADLSAETIALGLATAWNPVGILANAGVDVLMNSAIFFGGGYLFGVAFRPVRVEVRVFETTQGYPVWQETEEAFYARSDLKQLPESDRGKKELQLRINLERAMQGLVDSLSTEEFTVTQFGARPALAQQ